ncbi:MAG: putative OsmC-like protein [Parvicellaceae bacterium]|jgi:uncharacterized OsmC-like protein
MNYSIKAKSNSNSAAIVIKQSKIGFGITPETSDTLANPAELFLGAFSACILKNVARFSALLKFEYTNAEITVNAIRPDNPPRIDEINYKLKIYSQDENLKLGLLKKNIEKFGTIYNTVRKSCAVEGEIVKITE